MRPILWTVFFVGAASAQDPVQISVRHDRDWNSSSSAGWCAVKVWVEDEAEFSLQGDKLGIRTLAGRPGRDIATICSGPLPSSVEVFRLKHVDGRNTPELTEDPSRTRGSRATVRVRDPQAGAEEFHFRLEWERGSSSTGGSGGGSSSDGGSGAARSGSLNNDTRDVSRWRTADLRQEIERIYNDINRRYPKIDVIDGYIDRIRFERWTFARVAQDIDNRR